MFLVRHPSIWRFDIKFSNFSHMYLIIFDLPINKCTSQSRKAGHLYNWGKNSLKIFYWLSTPSVSANTELNSQTGNFNFYVY